MGFIYYTKPLEGRLPTGSSIGEHTYGSPKIVLSENPAPLIIGKYCSISEEVLIFLSGNHNTDWVSTYPFPSIPNGFWPNAEGIQGHPKSNGPTIIGNDVWIGWGATILPGITIGNGAVIGTRAVVTSYVEPYAIVAGNPARKIKRRFSDEAVNLLEIIKWWDLPDEKVNKIVKILCRPLDEENLHILEEIANG